MFIYNVVVVAASHCYVFVSFGRILPKTKMVLNGYYKDRFVDMNFTTAIRLLTVCSNCDFLTNEQCVVWVMFVLC